MREIPSLPAKIEPQLRNLLSAVRDAINQVIKGTKTNTDSINKLKQWVEPVFNPDYIATDDAASLLLDKFKGDSGDAVDIIFVRAATQPATPEGSLDTPTGWFTFVDDANASGVSLPLWSSVGRQVSGNTYIWEPPVRIEGGSVAELSIFVRSATAITVAPTGGTYAFSNPPVLVAPTSWFGTIPSGTDPVYTSRATVSAAAGNISAVAITGWSTPVISHQNGVNGITGLLTNEVHTIGTASDGTGGSFANAGGNFKVYSGLTDVSSSSTFAVSVATISGLTLTIGAATGLYSLAGTWTADNSSFTLTATYSGTTLTKIYTISKSKGGIQGNLGPTVDITSDRDLTFDSTDTTLVTSQSNIVLTATTRSMTGTITYAWSGSYFDTNPTAVSSTTATTYTITSAVFNSLQASTAGKITCSVTNNGITYTDTVTIVRLNSSTASAGATVGADWGVDLTGQPTDAELLNLSLLGSIDGNLIADSGLTLPAWWGMGAAWPAHIYPVNAWDPSQSRRFFQAAPGTYIYDGNAITVKPNRQYRISLRMNCPVSGGSIFVGMHIPNVAWATPGWNNVTVTSQSMPGHNSSTWGAGWQTKEMIVTTNNNSTTNYIQTRIAASFTGGYAEFFLTVTEVRDTDDVQDDAITEVRGLIRHLTSISPNTTGLNVTNGLFNDATARSTLAGVPAGYKQKIFVSFFVRMYHANTTAIPKTVGTIQFTIKSSVNGVPISGNGSVTSGYFKPVFTCFDGQNDFSVLSFSGIINCSTTATTVDLELYLSCVAGGTTDFFQSNFPLYFESSISAIVGKR
jgi:hypothetical protein